MLSLASCKFDIAVSRAGVPRSVGATAQTGRGTGFYTT